MEISAALRPHWRSIPLQWVVVNVDIHNCLECREYVPHTGLPITPSPQGSGTIIKKGAKIP